MIVVWLLAFALSWDPPWSTVTVDDFTRTALAVRWADGPFWAEPGLLWLPGHTYVLGGLFIITGATSQPLLVAALLNAVVVAAAALLLGATARRVFGSDPGALVVTAIALFAAWSRILAMSALVEALFVGLLVLVVYATVRWLEKPEMGRWLGVATGGLVALGLTRYEGWAVWGMWVVMVALALRKVGSQRRPQLMAVALLPGVVPLIWMAANWARFQDPLAFARTTEGLFRSGFGGSLGAFGRLLYYPLGFFRADALLTLAVGLASAIAWRRSRIARPVVTVVVGAFLVLWASSVLSGTIGLQPERFVYPYVLGLAWTLPAVTQLLRTRVAGRTVGALAGLAAVLFVGAALLRSDHPVEWNYPPDLLEVSALMAASNVDATVIIPADLPNEDAPIAVTAGGRIAVTAVAPEDLAGLIGPGSGLIVLERVPNRLADLPQPDLVVGRYSLFGEVPILLPSGCGDCDGWVVVDEGARQRSLGAVRGMLGLEMTGDDPSPGARAELGRRVTLGTAPRRASLEFLALYGRGFNPGRLTVEVTLDKEVLVRRDVAEPGGWQTVTFEVPAGEGTVDLVVAVVAEGGIEPTWGWGRASGVLVRHVDLGEGS